MADVDSHTVAVISGAAGVLAFLVNTIVLAVVGTRKLSAVEMGLRDLVADQARAVDRQAELERREFGETIAAQRQKINEVELYMRDNFVRRGSFTEVIQTLREQIEASTKRLEIQMDRLEDKLERSAGG